jgi:hypothetical protein
MTDCSTSRRDVVSAGLAGLVAASAGCAGSGDGPESAGRELRLRLYRREGPLREQFVVDLAEASIDRDEAAFAATLDGEPYTTRFHTPFTSRLEDPVYTSHEGTHYRLGSVVVGEATETRSVLRLSAVDAPPGESTPAAVDAEDLPSADRRAVEVAYMAARARGNEGGVPRGLIRRGGYVYSRTEAREASRLLADDGPERVRFRETTYDVTVAQETFHGPVYRATVVPVADAPERMEAILRARSVDARVSGGDLSADARAVLEDARADGYAESHPYSEGFRQVVRRLRARAYVDGNIEKGAGVPDDGRRMLRYDDVYYDYRLQFTSGERGRSGGVVASTRV